MQTLKTAAICVLMMTVLYGAYVSMTTPPDTLPPGVETMIVESDGLDLSEDFGQFELDAGVVDDGTSFAQNGGSSTAIPSPIGTNDDMMGLGAIDQIHADHNPYDSNLNEPESEHSFQMTDLNSDPNMGEIDSASPTQAVATRLPAVTPTSSNPIEYDPNAQYASTGADFQLPDPSVNSLSEMEDSGMLPSNDLDPPANLSPTANDVASAGLSNAIATADRQYAQDRRREALATLSLFYETPNLTTQQRDELLIRLDPLAREVIYSPDHLLEEPHRVTPSETLMKIAKQYDVPWQLLANINGIDDPVTVLPGTDLKVVRGPFRADVDLTNQELTLFLGDLYAGRFPIAIGNDPSPSTGTFTIQEKQSAKTYYDLSGNPVPPGNPRNPYGSMWIDLGSGICLHGSPQDDSPTDQGCISIAGNFARDVLGILSEGSSVTIR